MSQLTAVLLEQDRAVAIGLDERGKVEEIGRGESLDQAVDALSSPSDRIVVADARVTPVGAVVGVIDMISGQSATRALSLAGCSVAETVTINDRRSDEERLHCLVDAVPEIILLAGGTTQGTVRHLEGLSRVVGHVCDRMEAVLGYPTVILYAGNPEARDLVQRTLDVDHLHTVDNVRPSCEHERLEPAMLWAASLAPRLPISNASESRPAGAARSMAVRDLALLFEENVLLLRKGPEGSEAVSLLAGNWNRTHLPAGTLEDAMARHREQARELSGVSLVREVSDAFANHVAGRDLLDVRPPGILVAAGEALEQLPDADLAGTLVNLARPRGVVRLIRGSDAALTLLGLATLLGEGIDLDSYRDVMEDVAVAVSLDGPAGPVRVTLPGETVEVESGDLVAIPIREACEVSLGPLFDGDLGAGRGRRVALDLPPMPAGLLVDTRGTPVPPERRVRILPTR